MSVNTRTQIVAATLLLAESKPLNRITVRDIVDACGITRNTFYYYFHDIFDVFDSIVEEELDRVENASLEELDSVIFGIITRMVQYKKVWKNLLKTVGQEKLTDYVSKRLHRIFMRYLKIMTDDCPIEEQDMQIISIFFEEALMGVLIHWLKSDIPSTPEDMAAVAERISVLFKGNLDLLVHNSQTNPRKEKA